MGHTKIGWERSVCINIQEPFKLKLGAGGIYLNAPVKTVYLHTTVIHMKKFPLLWHPSSICYVIKGQKLAMMKVSLMDCWNNRVNSQCLNNGCKSKR